MNEPKTIELALNEYNTATNMTEQIAALAAIAQNAGDLRTEVLSKFYEQWKKDPLVRLMGDNFLEIPLILPEFNVLCCLTFLSTGYQ